MPVEKIFPGVYALALGPVNVFFIEDGDKLTLVDTGYENSEGKILAGAKELGKQPQDITSIVMTHCHPDHAGSLAALKRLTGAKVWMHRADAEVVRGNTPMNRSTPSPGIINWILYRVFIKNVPAYVPPAEIDQEISGGDVLPFGGGLKAYHTPGHSAGHTSFMLERDSGLLFAADACSNMMGLAPSVVYDDHEQGKRSLAALAKLDAAAICFGHGGVLKGSGVEKFKRKWAAS
jgi:glyoxylase-like metal-dependent hydrolase (beta-lactamase superfamily II)